MARKIRSPTRTLSNAGEYPRFIGHFCCEKSSNSYPKLKELGFDAAVPFDSITSLMCGIYLQWRKDVVSLTFEPRTHVFEANGELGELKCTPDYEVVLDTGEIEINEAKYSCDSMSERQREKLKLVSEQFTRNGLPYKVTYRDQLESNGFIQTIILLRRYRNLNPSHEAIKKAKIGLEKYPIGDLEEWRQRANSESIGIGLLYFMLYHQFFQMTYQKIQMMELKLWRD